jgi:hypothetical protein
MSPLFTVNDLDQRLSGSANAAYAVISAHISPYMESRLRPKSYFAIDRNRLDLRFPTTSQVGHRQCITFFGSLAVSARQWWRIKTTASRLLGRNYLDRCRAESTTRWYTALERAVRMFGYSVAFGFFVVFLPAHN